MKSKINWKDKEQVKAYKKAYYQRPEVKSYKKAYEKAYYQRPEVKAYHKAYKKAYYQRPEVKAHQKAYGKARKKSMVKIPGGQCYADGFSKIIQKQVPELTFKVMKKMLKEMKNE